MASRTDHDRQDAQHAVRLEVAGLLARYGRRVREEAYAIIEKEAADYDGIGDIDWFARGRLAAHQALGGWGIHAPTTVFDAEGQEALEAGADPTVD